MRSSIVALGLLLTAQTGCNQPWPTSPVDPIPPLVTLEVADTIDASCRHLHFRVSATDNLGLKSIGWTVAGVVAKDTLLDFAHSTTVFAQDFTLLEGITAGSLLIVATAVDEDDNEAIPDSATVTVIAQ